MAQQDINIGAQNAKTGDTLFDAFGKVQSNFDELYADDVTVNERIDVVDGTNPLAPAGGIFVSDGAGGGEFIRVQGWQQLADSRNTVGAPAQNIATGVRTQFVCNAVAANILKAPSDLTSPLWDTATNSVQPISPFDTFSFRFDFRAQNYSGTTPYITIELDIAGASGVIVSKTIPLIKGGNEQREVFSFKAFTGDTFFANGGKVFLTYVGTGTCDIFANTVLLTRDSKNYV